MSYTYTLDDWSLRVDHRYNAGRLETTLRTRSFCIQSWDSQTSVEIEANSFSPFITLCLLELVSHFLNSYPIIIVLKRVKLTANEKCFLKPQIRIQDTSKFKASEFHVFFDQNKRLQTFLGQKNSLNILGPKKQCFQTFLDQNC